jgi:hypothetical protein
MVGPPEDGRSPAKSHYQHLHVFLSLICVKEYRYQRYLIRSACDMSRCEPRGSYCHLCCSTRDITEFESDLR